MFTAKNLTSEELKEHLDNGDIFNMYMASKPYIDGGNLSYAYWTKGTVSDTDYKAATDEDKANWWYKQFNFAIANRLKSEGYCITASYEDGYLLTLEESFYDSSDKSINECRSLVRSNTSNSREYVFNVEWQNARIEVWKELGAIKKKSYTAKDGPMTATFNRAEIAGLQQPSSLIDWSTYTVSELTKEYKYRTPGGVVIPTEDGSAGGEEVPDTLLNEYTVTLNVIEVDFL